MQEEQKSFLVAIQNNIPLCNEILDNSALNRYQEDMLFNQHNSLVQQISICLSVFLETKKIDFFKIKCK